MFYKEKYVKYKQKYKNLKKILNIVDSDDTVGLSNVVGGSSELEEFNEKQKELVEEIRPYLRPPHMEYSYIAIIYNVMGYNLFLDTHIFKLLKECYENFNSLVTGINEMVNNEEITDMNEWEDLPNIVGEKFYKCMYNNVVVDTN